MCGGEIDRRSNINSILIGIHNEVKINNNIKFPKFYCFLSQFPISLFPIVHILRIAVHTIDSTASLPTDLPTLCNLILPPSFHDPSEINIFLKSSSGLLLPRAHPNSFLWNICKLITPFSFSQFSQLLYFEKFQAYKKLKEYYNEPYTLHLASPVNISPHFLHSPALTLPLSPPLSPSPRSLLSPQTSWHSKYFSIHFLNFRYHYTWTLSFSPCIS